MGYEMGKMIGGVVGALFGLLIAYIFLRLSRKDRAKKSKFDERQELVRGRGYKCSYYTLVVLLLGYGIVDEIVEKPMIPSFVGVVLAIILSATVLSGYCIWNEGYWALNENRRRITIGCVVLTIINLAIFAGEAVHGSVIVDGVVQFVIVNLACVIMMISTFLVMLVKIIHDRKEEI